MNVLKPAYSQLGFRIVPATCLALSFLSLSAVQSATRPSVLVLPSEPLYFTKKPAADLACQTFADMLARRIEIKSNRFVGGKVEFARTQHVATSYWPTRVLPFEDDRLIVAGRRANGNTVIELWGVKWPEVVSSSGGSGQPSVHISDLVVSQVDTIHDAATPGMDTVVGMTRMFGQPGSERALMVYFNDSKRLYKAAIGDFFGSSPNPTCGWAVLAAPALGQGGLVVPELNDSRRFEWFGFCHASHGFVYCLRNSASDDPPLLLCDSNLDRVFDYSLVLPDQDWAAAGLLDPALSVPPTY